MEQAVGEGCSIFAYSWKLPASFFAYAIGALLLTIEASLLTSGKVCLIN